MAQRDHFERGAKLGTELKNNNKKGAVSEAPVRRSARIQERKKRKEEEGRSEKAEKKVPLGKCQFCGKPFSDERCCHPFSHFEEEVEKEEKPEERPNKKRRVKK